MLAGDSLQLLLRAEIRADAEEGPMPTFTLELTNGDEGESKDPVEFSGDWVV